LIKSVAKSIRSNRVLIVDVGHEISLSGCEILIDVELDPFLIRNLMIICFIK
jgi:hypothetical protein